MTLPTDRRDTSDQQNMSLGGEPVIQHEVPAGHYNQIKCLNSAITIWCHSNESICKQMLLTSFDFVGLFFFPIFQLNLSTLWKINSGAVNSQSNLGLEQVPACLWLWEVSILAMCLHLRPAVNNLSAHVETKNASQMSIKVANSQGYLEVTRNPVFCGCLSPSLPCTITHSWLVCLLAATADRWTMYGLSGLHNKQAESHLSPNSIHSLGHVTEQTHHKQLPAKVTGMPNKAHRFPTNS